MKSFSISEMYTLELRWQKVFYEQDNFCRFKEAYFSGPVLKIAREIPSNDFIMMDFNKQYPIIIKGAYVAKFSWEQVEYKKGKVFLKNAIMKHDKLNKVPKLKNRDFIVIDTENHEEAVHRFNLVYISYVINENYEIYNFIKG